MSKPLTTHRDIAEQRGKDIIAAFFRTMQEHRGMLIRDIQELAAQIPAPRFYITGDRARQKIRLLADGKSIGSDNPLKVAMYTELFERYKAALGADYSPENKIKQPVVEAIILQPAPSFYIDGKTFKTVLYKAMKRK